MSAGSCCLWSPQSPNGRCWVCRIWNSSPACDGSCKTWNGFGRLMLENSLSNRTPWLGYLDEQQGGRGGGYGRHCKLVLGGQRLEAIARFPAQDCQSVTSAPREWRC